MELQVLWCRTELLCDARLFQALLAHQPEARRARILAIRRPEAQRQSLAAWSLLEAALDRLGVPAGERQVCAATGGKPYLRSGAVQFNLSHSGGIALCALGDVPLGADVQAPGALRPALVRRCCAEEERAWLSGQPEEAFFRLWARKESLLKACGCGLACDFHLVCCAPGDTVHYAGRTWRFLEGRPGGLPACVSAPEGVTRANWRQEAVERLL